MAKLKCKCGNTLFDKVEVNEYHNFTTNLHTTMREVHVDFPAKIYRCILCNKYHMPPTDYFSMSASDQKMYERIKAALEGKVEGEDGKEDKLIPMGGIGYVNDSTDPEDHGKFTVRMEK